MKTRIILPLVFSLAAAVAWSSEVYTWVDEDGVVHYTDKPPQVSSVEEVEVPETYMEKPEPGAESIYSDVIKEQQERREARLKQKEKDKDLRTAEREKQQTSEAYWNRAISYMNILKKQCPAFYDGAGILRAQCPGYIIFYEGERSYIDDDEREQLLKHYSDIVQKCRGRFP